MIMARKLKNVEKKTETLYGLEIFEKYWKMWKMEMHSVWFWNIIRILKNIENETQTKYDLEHGKNH